MNSVHRRNTAETTELVSPFSKNVEVKWDTIKCVIIN